MDAAILCIGDELLIGQVINTNAAWLGRELTHKGFRLTLSWSVPDDLEHIHQAFEYARKNARLVLITGGLGPTRDDKTRLAIARFFETEFVQNEEVLADVRQFIAMRQGVMNELNIRQADVPVKATILRNPTGTAPGLWLDHAGTSFVFLPGVPHEMKRIFTEHVADRIIPLTGRTILSETLLAEGIAESALAELLTDYENSLPQGFSLAYLPSPGLIKLRLTYTCETTRDARPEFNQWLNQLMELAKKYVFGRADESPQMMVLNKLKTIGATLATAESCTGGQIASLITRIPGCSQVYRGGIVAYHNDLKFNILGVSSEVLLNHGAVSREVVEQMATGCRTKLGADYAIAVSGIAGPSGGTTEKPVGTVWIAVASPTQMVARMFQFGNEREYTIERAANTALHMLRKLLP